MGEYQRADVGMIGQLSEQTGVGVVVEDESAVRRECLDRLEPHGLVDQYVRIMGQRRNFVTDPGVAADRHHAIGRLDPVADCTGDRFMPDTCRQDTHTVGRPDLCRFGRRGERDDMDGGSGAPSTVRPSDVDVGLPTGEDTRCETSGRAFRGEYGKRGHIVDSVHDPSGHHEIGEPDDMVTVVVGQKHRIDLRRPQPGSREALDSRSADVELQGEVVDPHQYAGPCPVWRWDRGAGSGDDDGRGHGGPF